MKLCVTVILMVIGASWAAVITDNTQPGCKTDTEISVKNYRNAWDPTAFWVCEQKGVAGVLHRCPDSLAWNDEKKLCVEWEDWSWVPPVHPPSSP